jgi:Na+-translocating ferredoxin:NAD+ oxidoreductase RnfG subunit
VNARSRLLRVRGRRNGRGADVDRSTRDRGASLVMAIGFVVLIGSIAAGLSGLVTSSTNNRLTLTEVRDRQYAADGAIEEAITAVRSLDRTTSGACSASAGNRTTTINGYTVRVDWQNVCGVVRTVTGELVAQRNVVFSACVDSGVACPEPGVILRAQVNFQQAATGLVTRTWVQSWSVLQ